MSQDKIKEIYEFFFKTADADGDGFVAGGEAAALFRKSGLTDDVLKSIWAQVSQGQPKLNKSGFFMALGLIGLAQTGREPRVQDIGKGKMLAPTFAGVTPPGSSLTLLQADIMSAGVASSSSTPGATPSAPSPAPMTPTPTGSAPMSPATSHLSTTGSSAAPASQPSAGAAVWAVPEQQKVVSASHFRELDVMGSGLLGGAESKDFFMKSQLPSQDLAKIWALSDVNGDGKLSLPEFQIAFFLTQVRLTQTEIPTPLPASMFESVGLPVPVGSPLVSPAASAPGSGHNSKTNSLLDVTPPHGGDASAFSAHTSTTHTTGSGASTPNGAKSGSLADLAATTTYNGSTTAASVITGSPSRDATTSFSSSLSKIPEIREEMPILSPGPSTASITIPPIEPISAASSSSSSSGSRGNADFRLTMRMDPAQLKAAMEAEAAGAHSAYMPTASGAPSSIPAHLMTANPASDDWLITSEQKATYDSYFTRADELGSGYVSGPRARELFTKASLPNSVLAEIWALSDTNNDGQLDRAEFALAMHLINLCRRGIKPPQTLPIQMLESAGINAKTLADVKAALALKAQKEQEAAEARFRAEQEAQAARIRAEQEAAAARLRAEQEAIAAQQRQQQLYLEQQAALARQEEERQEVMRMKAQIAALLREKERVVQAYRQQQQANMVVGQQLVKADYDGETVRTEVAQMEMQVEKAKIKGAAIKEHSETMMRHITAANQDKATLEGLLQTRRTQFMTEQAALSALEAQLAENRTALGRQAEDIAALRSSIFALEKARDDRASRSFDPHDLQQKLMQEKLRQDFAASARVSATFSPAQTQQAVDATSRPAANAFSGSTSTMPQFAAATDDSSWASFDSTAPTTATAAAFPSAIDDFGSVKGTTPAARPLTTGYENEQDEFGKSAPVSKRSPEKPSVAPVVSSTSPFAVTTEVPAFAQDVELPEPEDDFFTPAPAKTEVETAAAPALPARNTNPFPVEDEEVGATASAVAATHIEPSAVEELRSSPPPASLTNPFPSDDAIEAPAPSANKEMDDLFFSDVPTSETTITSSFGNADDLFGSGTPTSTPMSADFKSAFDEELF